MSPLECHRVQPGMHKVNVVSIASAVRGGAAISVEFCRAPKAGVMKYVPSFQMLESRSVFL